MARIESDYFVTGTGGSAMAFVDALLTESPDARIVMVDRHHGPGGHWNDAYPYVRLHQPSAWYGVASRELSDWSREATGFNEGMLSLASGAEVLAHFEQVMKQRFIPSGPCAVVPEVRALRKRRPNPSLSLDDDRRRARGARATQMGKCHTCADRGAVHTSAEIPCGRRCAVHSLQ
jgi:hypothetical protein